MPRETVIALRKQLREKFPAAHRGEVTGAHRGEVTGASLAPESTVTHRHDPSTAPLAPSDLLSDPARFPAGDITEISPAHPACGLTLLVASLIERAVDDSSGTPVPPAPALVLIDAHDHFDPASFRPETCARLLWLRCRETDEALKAADLLLRDGNLPHVLLDLSALSPRELRRIPAAAWHRLRQLAGSTNSTLLVLTPAPIIPGTALRLTLERESALSDLDRSREELVAGLDIHVRRHRVRSA